MTTTPGYTELLQALDEDYPYNGKNGRKAKILARAAELTAKNSGPKVRDNPNIERAAQLIYESWQFKAPPEYPWVPNGNSLEQDKARAFARIALAELTQVPAQSVERASPNDEEWEPGGTLGNDERYVRKSSPESTARVKEILGLRASPTKDGRGYEECEDEGCPHYGTDHVHPIKLAAKDGGEQDSVANVAAEMHKQASINAYDDPCAVPWDLVRAWALRLGDLQPLASQMRPQSAVQEVVCWLGDVGRRHLASRGHATVYKAPLSGGDNEKPLYYAPQPPQGEG